MEWQMAPGLHWRHDHCAWPGFLLVTGTLRAPALKEPGLAPAQDAPAQPHLWPWGCGPGEHTGHPCHFLSPPPPQARNDHDQGQSDHSPL